MFVSENGGFTWQIPYDEASKFDIIVGNILQANESQTGEASIAGTVISVKTEDDGRDISCVIKDKDNKTFAIDMQNTGIIDATGTGWLILHEHDLIKVFYKNDTLLADKMPIAATAVYIQNAAITLPGSNEES